MNTTTTTPRIYFQHLDLVRFLAALLIVLFHANATWNYWFEQPGLSPMASQTRHLFSGIFNLVMDNLRLSVDVFFLISGFLITYLLLEEKKRNQKIQIGKFLLRRTLRIWPLYFLLIALAPVLVKWNDSSSPNYLLNGLFLGNFEVIRTEQWTFPFSHYWSICIEEHFYLLWPFIIAWVPTRKLPATFAFLIVGSILFRITTFLMNPEGSWYTLYAHTLCRADILVIGAMGGWWYSRKAITFDLPAYARYLLLFLLLIGIVVEYVFVYTTPFMAGFKNYFFIAILAVLLLDFNFNPGFRHRLKSGSVFHYFGKVSYGIYMYGNILVTLVVKKLIIPYEISNRLLYWLLVVVLSLIVPILSYELFEKHILKFSGRFRVIASRRQNGD